MFKTVLKNVVCIYYYMGKTKIDSDYDSARIFNFLIWLVMLSVRARVNN